MSGILRYKTIDLLLQLGLLAGGAIAYLLTGDGVWALRAIVAFALVQVISILGHFSFREPWKSVLLRRIHHIGTVLIIAGLIIGLAKEPEDKYDMAGLEIVVWLTIPAILLALFYTVICFVEWKKLKSAS